MQVTVLSVLHVSLLLAGNVIITINGQAQSYPTGLRDDEDFASPGSGSGSEPPAVEPPMQSSGSEPLESETKGRSPEIKTAVQTTTLAMIEPEATLPSTTTTTVRPTISKSTTTTATTTTTITAPIYEVFTGVNQPQTTAAATSQLDESCLHISFIPSYPWPVKIYCNRETSSLRAICVVGQPPQTCYCVDPTGGAILYDVIYPNCGPVTQRTTPVTPLQTTTTSVRAKPTTKSTPARSTTQRPASRTSTTKAVPLATLQTTTFETSKIDQETLDARAETTKSWDQGVPVIATFMGQPGLLAAIICGAVVGLLTAVLLVMFLVYRMRKKDEGSYVIEEPSKRVPLVQPYERTREYYA